MALWCCISRIETTIYWSIRNPSLPNMLWWTLLGEVSPFKGDLALTNNEVSQHSSTSIIYKLFVHRRQPCESGLEDRFFFSGWWKAVKTRDGSIALENPFLKKHQQSPKSPTMKPKIFANYWETLFFFFQLGWFLLYCQWVFWESGKSYRNPWRRTVRHYIFFISFRVWGFW